MCHLLLFKKSTCQKRLVLDWYVPSYPHPTQSEFSNDMGVHTSHTVHWQTETRDCLRLMTVASYGFNRDHLQAIHIDLSNVSNLTFDVWPDDIGITEVRMGPTQEFEICLDI